MTLTICKPPWPLFSSMPKPDEVAFDLRIDVGQLIAGQIRGVGVERADGAAGVLHGDGRRRKLQLLATPAYGGVG